MEIVGEGRRLVRGCSNKEFKQVTVVNTINGEVRGILFVLMLDVCLWHRDSDR